MADDDRDLDTWKAKEIAVLVDRVTCGEVHMQPGEVLRVFKQSKKVRTAFAEAYPQTQFLPLLIEETRRSRKPHRLAVGDRVKYHVTSNFGSSYWHDGTVLELTRNFRGDPAYVVNIHERKDNFGNRTKTIVDSKNEIRTVEDHAARDVFEKVLLNDGLGLGIKLVEGSDHDAIKSAIAVVLRGHVFSRWN
jgi:hypothetical protein